MFSFFRSLATPAPIFLHNTLSGVKEEFTPLKAGEVRMYNCGPTVYGYQHIGNMRAFVFDDTLRRVFEYNGYKVKQVMNITDVGHLTGDNEGDADQGQDRMVAALRREGKEETLENMKALADFYAEAFFADLEKLLIKKPFAFPKASDHVREQIALVATLEEKGYTYATKDGVYFDTSRFPSYGKLGAIDIAALRAGARVEVNLEKRHPADFALWKISKSDIGWESPWGKGFPGWHLECSAMAMKYLGKSFDVHTGGIEHIPVHHNNEIAQSESATGKPFANYWLHNAHLQIEGKKIAKSVGNTIYLYQLVERGISPLAFRYLLLTSHYRSPMNFTWDALEGASAALTRLYRFFIEELPKKNGAGNKAYLKRFTERVNDDLDTPGGIAVLWELVKDTSVLPADKRALLLSFDRVLCLGLSESDKRGKEMRPLPVIDLKDLPEDIYALVKDREKARGQKDFEEADRIRAILSERGYGVSDSPEGTSKVWKEAHS